MLKNIPNILSPNLLKILMEMGHGDELVIADGNFPSASLARRLVRLDGCSGTVLLEAVLELFPLDTYDEYPVTLMKTVSRDDKVPDIWKEYESIIQKSSELFVKFNYLERSEFYQRSKRSFAIVATGETALYANIILKKGVVE
jgi:L-fucose mutarotase